MRKLALLTTLAAVTLSACSTGLSTTTMSGDIAPGTVVNGIPVRQRAQLTVELYHKTPKGYERVAEQSVTMADPTSVTVVDITGQALANPDLQLELYPDSTFKMVSMNVTNTSAEAAKSLGDAYKEFQTANTALRKARRDDKAQDLAYVDGEAAKAEAKLAGSSASAIAAAEAVTDAEVAELELAQLSAEAPQSERRAKIGEVQQLKMLANEKARLAGRLVMPFP